MEERKIPEDLAIAIVTINFKKGDIQEWNITEGSAN